MDEWGKPPATMRYVGSRLSVRNVRKAMISMQVCPFCEGEAEIWIVTSNRTGQPEIRVGCPDCFAKPYEGSFANFIFALDGQEEEQ